jgi:Tol biopolymer transport system component
VTFSPRSSLARLDLRSGNVRPLATGSFFSVADPSLSPSGQLAFIASRCASCQQRLTIMRGQRTATLAQAVSLTWVDKERLVVSTGRGEDTDIWLVSRNGRGHELEWLTETARRNAVETEKELVVSPDGRTLLFSGEGSAEHHGNYIVDLRRHRLLPLAGEADDAPTFSPDGRTIAYQQVSRDGDWDLCISRISLRAASHEHCFRSPGGNDREPAFLPNGQEIVFASDRGSRRSAVSSLYLLDLRTGSVQRLTPARYDAISPTVAADGRGVIFVRRALLPLR